MNRFWRFLPVVSNTKFLAADGKALSKGRLWLHGNKQTSPGLLGFVLSARKEPRGDLLRCVFSSGAKAPPSATLVEGARALDLMHNMFVDGVNGSYRAVLIEVSTPPPPPVVLFFT